MRKGIIGFAGLAILLLVASGCGGDESTVSKQEFDRQLEVVCNQGLKEREEFVEEIGKEFEQSKDGKPSKETQTENLRKLIAIYDETTEEIAELDLPEQGGEKVDKLVEAREDAAEKFAADPLNALGEPSIFAKANEAGEDLNAKSCAI